MMDEEAIPKWHYPTFVVVTLSNSFPLWYESNECPTEWAVFCFPFPPHIYIFLLSAAVYEFKRICSQNNSKLRPLTNSEHTPEALPGTTNKGPSCPSLKSFPSKERVPFHWDPSTFPIVLVSPSGSMFYECILLIGKLPLKVQKLCVEEQIPGMHQASVPIGEQALEQMSQISSNPEHAVQFFFLVVNILFPFCHCSPKYYI